MHLDKSLFPPSQVLSLESGFVPLGQGLSSICFPIAKDDPELVILRHLISPEMITDLPHRLRSSLNPRSR